MICACWGMGQAIPREWLNQWTLNFANWAPSGFPEALAILVGWEAVGSVETEAKRLDLGSGPSSDFLTL